VSMRMSNTQLGYGLILGAIGLMAAIWAGLALSGWRMPFPYTLVFVVLCGLLGAGVACLYAGARGNHMTKELRHE